MRNKLFLAVALIGVAAFAAQDAVTFDRKFKEGEKDTYKMTASVTMSMGSVDMTMTMVQTIRKVYENGDADLETAVSEMKVNFNGQEFPAPPIPPQAVRVNKTGMPIGPQKGGSAGMGVDFSKFAFAPDKPMKVGETITIDKSEKENPKNRVKGTIKLESITEGIGKLVANMEVWNEQTGDKAMKVVAASYISTTTAKVEKVEGTVSNLPAQQGMTVDAVQFTMVRVK